MLNYSYSQIEKAVRGKLLVPTRRKRFEGNVSTDTRLLKAGDLFIALRGPNFDGHNFVEQAFERGARLVFAEYKSTVKIRRKDPDIIFVEDCMQALGRLAGFHRREYKIPVIAITGSCGKTTTKELTAHLLSKRFKVLKSEGTENNFIGVPKTLLALQDHEVAVVEIGTNRKGEIRHLSRMVNPTHAVLTLIGNAHLAGFRNVEGVRQEKLSMIEALEEGSTVIFNSDDKNIRHERLKRLKHVRAGFSKNCEFYASNIALSEDGVSFCLNNKWSVKTRLLGRHNVLNILLACASAVSVGLEPEALKDGVESFMPTKGRVRHQAVGGVTWIDDSYNSNPTSLKAAIELFKSYPPRGRKILVLGDMLELGPRGALFHREAGESVAGYGFDLVLTVGELSRNIAEGAVRKGFSKSKVRSFTDSEEVGRCLKLELKEGDTVLLKGSRGMRMEKVFDICTQQETT